jgi:hypothetical protein
VKGIRHGFADGNVVVSTAWRRALNIPPIEEEGMRGFVVVQATNAIVEVMARVTVELVITETCYVAVPGRPVYIPVDRFGMTVLYRGVLVTPYLHDVDGVPSPTANLAGAGGVVAQYRPDGDAPASSFPALVARSDDLPGTTWANALLDLRVPLGPPGAWELVRAAAVRIGGGTSVNYTTIAATTGETYAADRTLEFNNTASAVANGINLPAGAAIYGASAPRVGYSRDGFGTLRLVVNAVPAGAEVHRVSQVWRYHGPHLPAPALVVL